jgi:UPF0755 protein
MSQASPAPRWRRMLAATAAGLALLALAAALALFWALGPVDAGDATPQVFEVEPGSGAGSIARALEAEGLLRDARTLLAILVLRGDQGRIGEGLYDLHRAMPAAEIADALVRGGRPQTERLLIPEGLRASHVVQRVAEAGWGAQAAELSELLRTPPVQIRPTGLPDGASLEGYLFPASYDLPQRWGAVQIVSALIARFERELDEGTLAALSDAKLEVHEWVILASMVQAEAGSDQEMPIIAGVFLNRLEMGMPLQSDPTVAYGLGKELPELSRPAGDFERDHPFNTYTRAGLPAGPISNPGRAALQAVLTPERRNDRGQLWLYFMHGVDGGVPVFRPNVSFDAHLRDVNRFLR